MTQTRSLEIFSHNALSAWRDTLSFPSERTGDGFYFTVEVTNMSDSFRAVLCGLNDMTLRDIQRCTNSDAHLEWGFRILFRLCHRIPRCFSCRQFCTGSRNTILTAFLKKLSEWKSLEFFIWAQTKHNFMWHYVTNRLGNVFRRIYR